LVAISSVVNDFARRLVDEFRRIARLHFLESGVERTAAEVGEVVEKLRRRANIADAKGGRMIALDARTHFEIDGIAVIDRMPLRHRMRHGVAHSSIDQWRKPRILAMHLE